MRFKKHLAAIHLLPVPPGSGVMCVRTLLLEFPESLLVASCRMMNYTHIDFPLLTKVASILSLFLFSPGPSLTKSIILNDHPVTLFFHPASICSIYLRYKMLIKAKFDFNNDL